MSNNDELRDWVLVPRKPTEEMIDAHFEAHARAKTVFADVNEVWAAMLKAAPASPTPSVDGKISEEMVEAAAKALFDRKEEKKKIVHLRWTWEDFAEPSNTKTFWRGEARAALEAALSASLSVKETTSSEPMSDGSERPMTAAEEVLVWLLIEKIGVPDDVAYSPDQAQEIISQHLDRAKELDQIAEMLAVGQGDDDGPDILPEFEKGWSVYAKVEACLHLLERRRDALSVKQAGEEADAAPASTTAIIDRIEDLMAEFGEQSLPMIGDVIGRWRHAAPVSTAEPFAWFVETFTDDGKECLNSRFVTTPSELALFNKPYYRVTPLYTAPPPSPEIERLPPLHSVPDRVWEAFQEAYDDEMELRPREGNEAMYRALLIAINMHRGALKE